MVAEQLLQNSVLELVAVVFAIAYLVLAVKESSLCWYAAGISTLIFLFIFWDVKLYMESGLQIYYLGMAFYGWHQWQGAQGEATSLSVSRWSAAQHVKALALIAVLTFASGSLLNSGTDANMPYLDSFTTWASVVTTFMVARKNTGKLDLLACYRFRIDLPVFRPRTLFHLAALRHLYCYYFLWLDGVE